MTSVCNNIIFEDVMVCKKEKYPTLGGAFCPKWEYDSTFSRTKNLPRQIFWLRWFAPTGIPKGCPLGRLLFPLGRAKGSAARHERINRTTQTKIKADSHTTNQPKYQ